MATFSTPTTPRTLLEAVNTLLRAVRITGVMSLNAADLNEDAASAKAALDDAVRETLLRGWECNTEYAYKIDPSSTGEIALPGNTLKARTVRGQWANRLVKRGLKLYDNHSHTYSIGKTVELDLVVALPFDELPESMKLYVTALAARRWCVPKLPSQATFEYTQEVLAYALARTEEEDNEVADNDLASTSPHFALHRRR